MDELTERAKQARERAYAPYSGYAVGAAIRDEDGRIWAGCNVENVSYPLAICAERSAVAKMVLEGSRQIEELVLVTRDGATPCGMCLQTLLEFTDNPDRMQIQACDDSGRCRRFTLRELLPHGFRSEAVKRTDPN